MKRAVIRGILSLVMALGIGAGISAVPVSSVCAYSSPYHIDKSSAWWDRDNHMFGAGVTDNNTGEYFTATYRVYMNGNYYTVYESKNGGNWVEIGEFDRSRVSNAEMPRYTGILFVWVANACAQTRGYEKMF